LIGVMVFTFARVSAACGLNVAEPSAAPSLAAVE
jgi:hypothetical protein